VKISTRSISCVKKYRGAIWNRLISHNEVTYTGNTLRLGILQRTLQLQDPLVDMEVLNALVRFGTF